MFGQTGLNPPHIQDIRSDSQVNTFCQLLEKMSTALVCMHHNDMSIVTVQLFKS